MDVLPAPKPLPPRKRAAKRPLEKDVEAPVCKRARGLGCTTLKIAGAKDWPDRLIKTPSGFMFFIEFKRPDEKPRPSQRILHTYLSEKGALCYVIDNAADGNAVIDKHLSDPPADPRVWLPVMVDLAVATFSLRRVHYR